MNQNLPNEQKIPLNMCGEYFPTSVSTGGQYDLELIPVGIGL